MAERWVVLDMMWVICEEGHDVTNLLVPYVHERDKAILATKIKKLYSEASLGRISSFDFWKSLGLGGQYPQIETDYLDSCPRLDPEFIGTVKQLAKDYSLAILSNGVKEWAAHLRLRFGIADLFKAIVISGEVGWQKPEEKIYEILLDRIQAPPSACVFVDDRAANLRPAHELGIKTIRFARESPDDDFTPDLEITSFNQLPAALQELFSRLA